jgi:NADH:ubiquinone oxidoreductase subunit K
MSSTLLYSPFNNNFLLHQIQSILSKELNMGKNFLTCRHMYTTTKSLDWNRNVSLLKCNPNTLVPLFISRMVSIIACDLSLLQISSCYNEAMGPILRTFVYTVALMTIFLTVSWMIRLPLLSQMSCKTKEFLVAVVIYPTFHKKI